MLHLSEGDFSAGTVIQYELRRGVADEGKRRGLGGDGGGCERGHEEEDESRFHYSRLSAQALSRLFRVRKRTGTVWQGSGIRVRARGGSQLSDLRSTGRRPLAGM